MESWVQSWRPHTNAFAFFPFYLSKVLRLPRKSEARSCEVLRLSRKIILGNLKTWCSKMQPLSRNQCPDLLTSLMNMSLVLRLPREMYLCRSSFLEMLQNPHVFAHFWEGAESLAPATQNNIGTSKSGPSMWWFYHVHFQMCFGPQRRALFRRVNFQKWSEHGVLCAFWLRNVLRATTACTFFDMSTSTSGPSMVRFAHFNFDMCFAPQRRALFRHLNFQKCSDAEVFCAFFLRNVLRATTACNFSSLISPHGSAPAFSEPTFRPSRATNHWKNTDFATFSRICIVFPLTLSLLWSSFLSSLLWLFPCTSAFPSVHTVGSLTSKLRSNII